MTDIGEMVAYGAIALLVLASGFASAVARRTFHSVMFLGVVLVGVAGYYILLGSALVGVIQVLVYVGGILTLFIFAVMFVAGDEKDDEEARPTGLDATAPSALRTALAALAGLAVAGVLLFKLGIAGALGAKVAALHPDGVLGTLLGLVGRLLGIALAAMAGIAVAMLVHRVVALTGRRILGAVAATALAAVLLAVLLSVGAWKGDAAPATDANDLTLVTDALFGPLVVPFEILGILLTAVMFGALVIARPLTVRGAEESSLVHPNVAAAPSVPLDAPAPIPSVPPAAAQEGTA